MRSGLRRRAGRVGEIFQRRAELLDREHQFLRCYAPHAGLDGRNGLAVLEAEMTSKAVLRKLALFAQGLDSRADLLSGHQSFHTSESGTLLIASTPSGAGARDGISYLVAAKQNGIVTPLMADYEREILRQTGGRSLEEALAIARRESC